MLGRSLAPSRPRRTDCVSAALSPVARAAESLHEVSLRRLSRAMRHFITHLTTGTEGAATKAVREDGVAESWNYDLLCAALVHSASSPRVPATPAPGRGALPSSVPDDAAPGVRCVQSR